MIAIRTPATQDLSRSPRKGQIPYLDHTRNPSVLMDQSNLGHDFFPPSPFPPISSTGKQSLTKPRMLKARKGASSKSRPPASDPNPSPFRSNIEERLSGWNPFVPDSGARVSDAGANSDAGVFIFGGTGLSMNSSQNSDASLGSGAFVFGSGGGERTGLDLSRTSSVGVEEGSRLNTGKSGNFGEEVEEEEGFFVFGSSVEESSRRVNRKENEGVFLFRKTGANETLQKTEKLNMKETNTGGGNSSAFVFGSSMNERNEEMERSNLRETIESGDSAAGVFVFGSSIKESLGSGQPSKPLSDVKESVESKEAVDVGNGFVSEGNTVNTLHDDLEKLKIGRESENFFCATPFNYTFQAGKKDSSSSMGSFPPSQAEAVHVEFRTPKQDASWVTKETGRQEQVNVNKGFVYRSRRSVTGSFGGSAVNMVHDDMARPKTGCKGESFVGRIPVKSSFPAGEHHRSSSVGSVPPFQAAAPPFHPPPLGPTILPVGAQFTFGSRSRGSEAPPMEFQTPKHDASRLTKENLFSEPSQNIAFSAKRGEVRGMKLKKKKVRSRQPASYHQSFGKQFVHMEGGFQENPETEPNDGYSPMDCSPYREDTVADEYSREASVASDDSSRFISRHASTDTQRSISVEEREEVPTAAQLDINYGSNLNQQEFDDNDSKDRVQISSVATSSFEDEQIFGYEKETSKPKYENMRFDCHARTALMEETETCSLGSNFERDSSAGETGFIFSSSIEESSQSKFAFTSSSFAQGNPSQKRHYRRRSGGKPVQDSYLSTPNGKVIFASPSPNTFPPTNPSLASVSSYKGISFLSQNEDCNKAAKGEEQEAAQEPAPLTASCVAVQEACEKWRQRGNQAYTNGYLSKAEDYYTRGINSVSLKETTNSCIRPLILCYSNRAATRMSLQRMREALGDCKMALTIDPNFLRAQVRAANCYLSLGEIGEALKAFNKCLQKEDVSSNQKIVTEASDGLEKAQQVSDLTGQSAELLLRRTLNDASKALQIISDALLISPLSESLLEMKAEALLMMRSYEEVIQLCEETHDLAERNCVVDSQLKDVVSSELLKSSPARLWRWRLIAKSYFYLGKLEDALDLLQKHDTELGNRSSESSTPLAVTIRELLRLKAAGNEAFQAARHSEAVECYNAALVSNAESRPFAAVCFCNRAAAYQALGQIPDAIADCSLAIALDPSYQKAISRRATLHEMIRDYGQAANDLQRLVSLLEMQPKEKNNQSRTSGRSIGYDSDLKRARIRLAAVEEEARKGRSLNMYMILGIEPSSSPADVKKAYRKAALRHHPDKAGQFLVRNENVDDGLWKEVADEVHNDADRLFKMIGESYAILSDPTKRLQYYAEEEIRTSMKKGHDGTTPSKTSADSHSSHYERNINRGQWRAQGSSHQRW